MTKTKTLALAAACTMTGAGGALATDAITTSAHNGPRHTLRAFTPGAGLYLGRAVHAEAILATRDGFKDAAYDRGVVKSVSGNQLTLTEGKGTTTREQTLTIPSDAKVRVPGKRPATLSDVTAGMKAVVVTLGDKTAVFAHAPRP
jgi:hypothetical protein